MTRCLCGLEGVAQCGECRRTLCVSHYAIRPVSQGAGKPPVFARVCHPVCDAPWWRAPTPEWTPEFQPRAEVRQ